MNSSEFAHTWLKQNGLFDKDSDYDGALGEQVMEVWACIVKQGHSGGSASRIFALLQAIYQAYDDPLHPIWQAYWQSDEGKHIKAQLEGRTQ